MHCQNVGTSHVLTLPVGPWFRTWPLVVIVSDDGTKLEATALSPRYGVVSSSDPDGTMGASPLAIELYGPGEVYDLEVSSVAFRSEFMAENVRKAPMADPGFLDSQ